MILNEDTLYYRADHPNGFLFSAGNEAPAAEDGWVVEGQDIPAEAPPAYECSTLAAFDALLRTERQAAALQAAELAGATHALAVAAVQRDSLFAEISRLNEEIAALQLEQGD